MGAWYDCGLRKARLPDPCVPGMQFAPRPTRDGPFFCVEVTRMPFGQGEGGVRGLCNGGGAPECLAACLVQSSSNRRISLSLTILLQAEPNKKETSVRSPALLASVFSRLAVFVCAKNSIRPKEQKKVSAKSNRRKKSYGHFEMGTQNRQCG